MHSLGKGDVKWKRVVGEKRARVCVNLTHCAIEVYARPMRKVNLQTHSSR
jgi:hypothetical protein